MYRLYGLMFNLATSDTGNVSSKSQLMRQGRFDKFNTQQLSYSKKIITSKAKSSVLKHLKNCELFLKEANWKARCVVNLSFTYHNPASHDRLWSCQTSQVVHQSCLYFSVRLPLSYITKIPDMTCTERCHHNRWSKYM